MSIKAWDWDQAWKNILVSARTIMSLSLIHITNRHRKAIRVISLNLAFKSNYADTFLSACLDNTINMWTLGSSIFSMQEHEMVSSYHRRRQDRQESKKPHTNKTSPSLSSISIYPSESSSVAVKMEQPESGKTALIVSKTRYTLSYALEVRTCTAHSWLHSEKTPTK